MSKVRVHNFTISLDGFGTGVGQSLEAPFGHGGHIMDWFKKTLTFNNMIGTPENGETGIDEGFASQWGPGIGVEIMGRNKFTPERGPWLDENWQGWWGDNPPFHTPCIVLTHHKREPLEMQGGTTFYFMDASPKEAIEEAKKLSGEKDIRIGGGATSLRQFFDAKLIDYAHIAIAPVFLGKGERLFENSEALEKHYEIKTTPSPSGVIHVEFEKIN